MNRIARTAAHLVAATGLAAAALTLSGTAAHAEGPNNGPGTIQLGPIVDPEGPTLDNGPTPEPKPEPQVDGPDEVTDAPNCTHGCGGKDDEPGDTAPAPEPQDDQPADEPADAPAPDQGCFTGCDLPEENAAPENTDAVVTPNRVDAGQDDAFDAAQPNSSAPRTDLPAAAPSDDSGLGWYVGLGLFSAAAALAVALIARRLADKNQEEVQHA